MSRDQVSTELLELARQNGIDLDKESLELNDEELEAVSGGKQSFAFGGGGFFAKH